MPEVVAPRSTLGIEVLRVNKPEIDPKMKTPAAAVYTGLKSRTLEKLRQTGGGPIYLKVGRSVLYAQSDLDTWLQQRRRASTSDPGR